MKNHFVHTPCGPVQGAAGGADGVSVFRGIRYATAGRWEYPRQVTHWDGVYDAANFGARSTAKKTCRKRRFITTNSVGANTTITVRTACF